MSDKDAAKRRRQARNRQERINRQKRIDGARRSEKARSGGSSSEGGTSATGRPSRAPTAAPASGGFLGKLFPPRPSPAPKGEGGAGDGKATGGGAAPRPARTPQPRESVVVEIDDDVEISGFRAEVARRLIQPGGRATSIAVILALVAVGMLFTAPLVPRYVLDGLGEMAVRAQPGTEAEVVERVQAFEDADPVTFGTQRLTEVLSPVVVAGFSLVLLLIVGTAFRSLTRPTRSRTLLVSSFSLVAVMFVLGQILLPLLIALAFASYQSRKADRLAAVQGQLG